MTLADWCVASKVRSNRQQHLKASKEALNLVSFNLLYGDFGNKEDAEWQAHNEIHQFASYNGRAHFTLLFSGVRASPLGGPCRGWHATHRHAGHTSHIGILH